MINQSNGSTSQPIVIDPITIRTAVDLVEVVPFLLGFHPQHSVVALMLDFPPRDTGRLSPRRLRLSLTARVDIGSGEESPIGEALDVSIREHDAIALFAFTDSVRTGQTLLRALRRRWATQTVSAAVVTASAVLDVIAGAEHPRHGESTGRVAAEAVGRGMVITHSNRDQLASTVQPGPAAMLDQRVRDGLAGCPDPPETKNTTELLSLLDSAVSGRTSALDDAALVSLAMAVQHIAVRDRMWVSMTTKNAPGHVQVWAGLARRLGSDLCLPVLGLLGFAGWLQGDGALANIALERAQAIPDRDDYTMIRLLAQILEAAIPPDEWSRVSAQLASEIAVH